MLKKDKTIYLKIISVVFLVLIFGIASSIDRPQNQSSARINVNSCPSGEVTEENLYISMLENNQNKTIEPPVSAITEFRSITNSEGFRDHNFSTEKPDNQLRIAVIGDSQTYGLGVNQSNRFTEVLESKLSEERTKNVEVLNLGIPGAGMKDYYQIARNKVIDYDPDLVVVAFDEEDIVFRSLQDRYIAQVKENQGISEIVSVYSNEKAKSRVYDRLNQYRKNSTWKKSVFREYMLKILAINNEYNFDLYLYRISNDNYRNMITEPVRFTEYETVYDYLKYGCGKNIIEAPPDLEYNSKYTFHPDSHFNKAGHNLIGNRLFQSVQNQDILNK